MRLFDLLMLPGLALVLGLLLGSFLNVVIHRLPRMLRREMRTQTVCAARRYNLAWPRSHCPSCRTPLPCWQNLPLLSFVWLRGRCAFCRAAIAWRYPLVELLTAACFALLAWTVQSPWLLCGSWFFSACLLALAVIDLECGLLPDVLTLGLLWVGLLFNLYGGPVPLDAALPGVLAGYLSLWLLYWGFYWLSGREGLGYGDFKLLAALGAWLGWSALPLVLLLSSLTGLLLGGILLLSGRMSRADPLPFGPFLACSGWLVWFVDFCL